MRKCPHIFVYSLRSDPPQLAAASAAGAVVRKIKGRNKFQPSSIDGIVNEEDIARCFSLRYNDLYNSVPSDNGEMISIDTETNNRVTDGVTA